jgi:hypothetical protein
MRISFENQIKQRKAKRAAMGKKVKFAKDKGVVTSIRMKFPWINIS